MKTQAGVQGKLTIIELGTRWEWSASRLGRFTPTERAPRYLLNRRMSGLQNRSGRCDEKNLSLPHACFFLGLFFDPEDGGDMFLRNVDWLSMDNRAFYLTI
jgi:hypothetical protein